MRSFIVGRTQTVHYCGSVESLGFGVHLYADDTQVHGSCAVSEVAGLAGRAVRVVNEIKNWMSSNRLRLNADKTQFIWLGTGHFLGNRDTQVIDTILSSTDVVNNLGVYLDSELTLERQVIANFVKFAISTCIAYARYVDRFRRNAYAHWFMPSSLVELITATASFMDLIHIFSTGFSPC